MSNVSTSATTAALTITSSTEIEYTLAQQPESTFVLIPHEPTAR